MRWASFKSGKSFWYVICTQLLLSKRLLNFLYKILEQETKHNKNHARQGKYCEYPQQLSDLLLNLIVCHFVIASGLKYHFSKHNCAERTMEWLALQQKNKLKTDLLKAFKRSNRKRKESVSTVRLDCGLIWLERV